jgi:hypothetical protein
MKIKNSKKWVINRTVTFLICLLTCIIFVGCAGCDLRYGVLETSFRLADDSRLPKWFNVPKGYSRSDLRVTIDFYTSPCFFCKDTVTTLYGPPPDNKEIMKKAGKFRWHPLSDRDLYNKYPATKFPNYTIVKVDGIDEVFEQRQAGNSLYITDDPNITAYNNK